MILVDTTVLSLAFRRSRVTSPVALQFRRMVQEDVPLFVPGIVFQEVLSGIREPRHFTRMLDVLAGFPKVLADERDHAEGARIANQCRRVGIATTAPDCLIAAQCIRRDSALLTTDHDFQHMAPHIALRFVELEL